MLTPESSSEIHLFWGNADLLSEPQKSSRQPVPRGSRLFRPNPWTGCRLADCGECGVAIGNLRTASGCFCPR